MNSGLSGALISAPLRTAAARRVLNGSVLLMLANRGALFVDAIAPGNVLDSNLPVSNGANRRGPGAIDLQSARSNRAAVASGGQSAIGGGVSNTAAGPVSTVCGGISNSATGSYATVLGGSSNTASATASVAGGSSSSASANSAIALGSACAASGAYSAAFGSRSAANRTGQISAANGFFAALGDAQRASVSLRISTAATTQVELSFDGAAAAGTAVATATRFIIEANTTVAVDAYVSWRDSAGLSGFAHRRCLIKRDGANNTVLVGAVQTIGTDYDQTGGAAVNLAADDTNEALQVLVTPFNATPTRWHAELQFRIIGY